MVNKTFVIIKPDAIYRGLIGKVISRFEDKGLAIIALSVEQKTRLWCRSQYGHINEPIYTELENFILCRPIIGVVLYGVNAAEIVRKMIGQTDSLKAEPGTIRGDFGSYPIRFNVVHAADSYEAVDREIKLFFGRDI